jgi:hypothetical protein
MRMTRKTKKGRPILSRSSPDDTEATGRVKHINPLVIQYVNSLLELQVVSSGNYHLVNKPTGLIVYYRVMFFLESQMVSSGNHHLDNAGDDFERNQLDKYDITCKDVGTISHIQVCAIVQWLPFMERG